MLWEHQRWLNFLVQQTESDIELWPMLQGVCADSFWSETTAQAGAVRAPWLIWLSRPERGGLLPQFVM